MKHLILVLVLLTVALLLNIAVENRLDCSPSPSVAQPQPAQETVVESAHLQATEESVPVVYVRKLNEE